MKRSPRPHPEWVLMADAGIPFAIIARLNDIDAKYVRDYVRRRGEAIRGGPAPAPVLVHDRPVPRPVGYADTDRRWRARLTQLEAFLAEHHRRPHSPRNETDRGPGSEWALAHWLTTQRSKHGAGRLLAHRMNALDRVLPSWRVDDRTIENEAKWRLTLVEVLRFHQERGRCPASSRVADSPERVLADWLRNQRLGSQAGELGAERGAWLDRQVPCWRFPRSPGMRAMTCKLPLVSALSP
ncbi:helicase associated domain-containing protein [Citricoccus sp. I39-566]|uniref:helicase associated domain-containing protein n=1 Tax=Citricoccus sp. I39-566 TaxID=3073268 RepID=UPI00286B3F71|nr:helicase associated domain-containing protein [Citricoccus sp. I39-566]WMY80067.1 helicase associated domain-containing protein [Citricoccus sp. I39-566]